MEKNHGKEKCYLALQRGKREKLVISRQTFKGVVGLDIRRHFCKKGESVFRHSTRGVRLLDHEVRAVAEILNTVIEQMDEEERNL